MTNRSDKIVVLEKGKEKALQHKHHWIFSGAVKKLPEFENGEILTVQSYQGEFLGYAYFNRKCSIIGRVVSFDQTSPEAALEQRVRQSIALRKKLFDTTQTNAYRLINSEGDGIPGLIVDQYNDVLVIQISTLGIEKLKPFILKTLVEACSPRSILEKSNLPSRREEGLPNMEAVVFGEPVSVVEIKENNLRFEVNFERSQKTGFFFDQREMRQYVQTFAPGKRVLNCFSYTGGFSVYALAGNAIQVDSVDVSEKVIRETKNNLELNHFDIQKCGLYVSDVFEYLREKALNYDLMILDPPAFAKKRNDVVQACRGYKEINRLALTKLPEKSFLLTCSCSYFVDEKLFQQVLFQAAADAKRNVRILQKHHLAPDHPINIFHPEGSYLKSLFLYVE